MLFTSTFRITLAAACLAGNSFGQLWTDAADDTLPPDFQIQGEYAGDGMGAQVIALGKGSFHAVIYP